MYIRAGYCLFSIYLGLFGFLYLTQSQTRYFYSFYVLNILCLCSGIFFTLPTQDLLHTGPTVENPDGEKQSPIKQERGRVGNGQTWAERSNQIKSNPETPLSLMLACETEICRMWCVCMCVHRSQSKRRFPLRFKSSKRRKREGQENKSQSLDSSFPPTTRKTNAGKWNRVNRGYGRNKKKNI